MTTPTHHSDHDGGALPLAVWPCAHEPLERTCENRRAPAEIARRAISVYSEPGDLVVDPLCTDYGATLIEAIRQERNAAAVVGHDLRDATLVLEWLGQVRLEGPCGEAALLRGDPPELPRLLAEQAEGFLRRHRHARPELQVHPSGSVDLILLSLPAVLLYGREQHSHRWHQPFTAFDVLAAAAIVLRPGGFLACVSKSAELEGTPRDLGGETVPLCTELGLAYWQHVIALLVPIEDGQLTPRRERRRRRRGGQAAPPIAHADVHVFRKPTSPPARLAADVEAEQEWWQ